MTSEPAFDLRCRDAEWIDRPTTLDEFSRPAAVGDRYRALTELLFADMIARTQTEIARLLEGRVLLSVENARFGIPVGVRDLDAPPIDDWRLQEQIDVELLDEGPDGRLERSVAAQFRRGLIAVAGALPLLASPILAHAHAPLEPAALARMATGFAPPPKLPEEPATTPTAAPTVTPESPTEAPATEPPQPQTTAAPPVTTTVPAPRVVGGDLTLTGTNVWAGLLGQRVKLLMKNEQNLDGTLVAQSTTDLAIARSSDGTVVSVPKAEIAGIRLGGAAGAPGHSDVPVSERPTNDGHGLYGGGAAMIGIGSTAALAGT
ncbi:MAG TPA: hypothetical protein VK034_24720, partial [Enhygromyxa sp.]|nr:hypothetical protein [Enhygromyxa sp.]